MSDKPPVFLADAAKGLAPTDRIAIAAARFNAAIVDELVAGCRRRLVELGVDASRVALHRVPGAFELPLAARVLARTGRFAAVICLGAVIRGQTAHFEHVAGECARGIASVSREELLPVIFGVLTTETEEQALDRIGGSHGHAGESAADAAVEMIALMKSVAHENEENCPRRSTKEHEERKKRIESANAKTQK